MTPAERAQFARNSINCADWYTSGHYSASLAACTAAIRGFEQQTHIQSNPWYAYYMKATMLRYSAADNGALGHHHTALQTAIASHQLALYVYKSYRMDADDYANINSLVKELQTIEDQERKAINRGLGD
jgi:hypothetical protein